MAHVTKFIPLVAATTVHPIGDVATAHDAVDCVEVMSSPVNDVAVVDSVDTVVPPLLEA